MRRASPDPGSGVLRAAVLSWLAVTLSAIAHLVSGGVGVAPTSMLFLALALVAVGTPLSRNAFRLSQAAPVLVGQQLAAHVVFSLSGSHHGQVRPTARLAAALDNPHATHPAGAPTPGSAGSLTTSGAASSGMSGLLPSPGMLAAHLVAAVVIAAALASAERGSTELLLLHRGRSWLRLFLTDLGAYAAAFRALSLTGTSVAEAVRTRRLAATVRSVPTVAADVWRAPVPRRRGPPALLPA